MTRPWIVLPALLALLLACADKPSVRPPERRAPTLARVRRRGLPRVRRGVRRGAGAELAPDRFARPLLVLGAHHSCAIAGGRVRCWGDNGSGQLLLPESAGAGCGVYMGTAIAKARCVPTPTAIAALEGARKLALGEEHTCAIDARGQVSCWGDAPSLPGPQEGLHPCGTARLCSFTPRLVPGLAGAQEIGAGASFTCARTDKQEVWCWGSNDRGQVGAGAVTAEECNAPEGCPRAPARVAGVSTATAIAVGDAHACALLADGTVRCWGLDRHGQVGSGATGETCHQDPCRATPVAVKGLDRVKSVAAGTSHTCALREDGSVLCWGANNSGEIGDGTFDGIPCNYNKKSRCRFAPTPVADLHDVVEIAAGGHFTCARTAGGQVQCWGDLPGAPKDARPVLRPQPVAGISGATRIFANVVTACALTGNGPRCWGSNLYGQLGDGTVQASGAPVEPQL